MFGKGIKKKIHKVLCWSKVNLQKHYMSATCELSIIIFWRDFTTNNYNSLRFVIWVVGKSFLMSLKVHLLINCFYKFTHYWRKAIFLLYHHFWVESLYHYTLHITDIFAPIREDVDFRKVNEKKHFKTNIITITHFEMENKFWFE